MKKVLAFIWKYLVIFFKALGKFLKYVYGSNILCLFEAVLLGLFVSELLGAIFVSLSLILWLNDYQQAKPKEIKDGAQ